MNKRYMTAAFIAAALLLAGCGKTDSEIQKKPGTITAQQAAKAPESVMTGDVAVTVGEEIATTTTTKKAKSKKNKQAEEASPEEIPQETAPAAETQAVQTQLPQETPQTEAVQETQPQQTQAVQQAEAPQPAVTAAPVVTEPPVTEAQGALEPDDSAAEIQQEPARANRLSVNCIMQRPELPTGCEVTSLTMLLNYYGIYADKVDLSRNYLPKTQFYEADGVLYGADFRTSFAGDPESEYSYGCYAPCIVTAANSYLSAVGAGAAAYDISGTSLESLFDYIDGGSPVLIWITSDGLAATSPTDVWTTPGGYTVQWLRNEHCVVLTGYDLGSGTVNVSDPLYGNTSYDMALLETRYRELGSQCVIIE